MIKATLAQLILNATAIGRSLLLAADELAVRNLLDVRSASEVTDEILGAVADLQPADADLTAIAALSTTAFGRSLLTQVDASAARSAVGLGAASTPTFSGLNAGGGNVVSGGLTINPTNGGVTIGQTFGVILQTSNMLQLRHGGNDYCAVRPTAGTGAFTPAGFGAIGFTNISNAIGVYIVPTAAGTLAVRTAAHADANFTAANVTASGLIGLGTYTVATLPSAAANPGRIAQVTDSSVTANGSAVAGGGANRVMVFSNGTSWDVVVA
jgi:hypothetical protein